MWQKLRSLRIYKHGLLLGMLPFVIIELSPEAAVSATKRQQMVSPRQGILDQSKTIAKNPNNTKAYLRRAYYHLILDKGNRQDHLRAAADDLAVASRLAPKNPDIHRQYAELSYRLEEHQLAVSEYSAALKLAPGSADVYLGRGLAYLWLRQDKRAKADFKEALKHKPALRDQLEQEVKQLQMARHIRDVSRVRDVGNDMVMEMGCTRRGSTFLIMSCDRSFGPGLFP